MHIHCSLNHSTNLDNQCEWCADWNGLNKKNNPKVNASLNAEREVNYSTIMVILWHAVAETEHRLCSTLLLACVYFVFNLLPFLYVGFQESLISSFSMSSLGFFEGELEIPLESFLCCSEHVCLYVLTPFILLWPVSSIANCLPIYSHGTTLWQQSPIGNDLFCTHLCHLFDMV